MSPIIGDDPRWIDAMRQIAYCAQDGSHLLIHGPSGTGKEIGAREYHRASGRRGRHVIVNCCTLTPDLAHSLLEGHVKGSFTGAMGDRDGLAVAANHGTLQLDELAHLCPEGQGTLLRLIDNQEVRPVGSSKVERVDVRVIGTTKVDLWAEVEAGRFREDLYFRIAQSPAVWLPPISERCRSDREAFVRLFLSRLPAGNEATAEAISVLANGEYRLGGLRELEQAVRGASIRARMTGSAKIHARHVDPSLRRRAANDEPTPETILQALWEQSDGQGFELAEAIERLGVSKSQAHRTLRDTGFEAVGGGRSYRWVRSQQRSQQRGMTGHNGA